MTDKRKRDRPSTITFRPYEGVKEKLDDHIMRSGHARNAIINHAILETPLPRQRRTIDIDAQLFGRTLGEIAQLKTIILKARECSTNNAVDEAVLRVCEDFVVSRNVLILALRKKP